MYVCNCNGITKRQVEAAKRGGARRWHEVYAHYDCKPCCGKCIPEVCQHLNDGADEPVGNALLPAFQAT